MLHRMAGQRYYRTSMVSFDQPERSLITLAQIDVDVVHCGHARHPLLWLTAFSKVGMAIGHALLLAPKSGYCCVMLGKRKTGDKLGDIRRATIAEVVERGSSSASVNAIARRAGLAVGTIYRYYENKEQLLRAVQMAIKTELHDQVMADAACETGSKAKIRAMWFSILKYAHENPDSFLFSEVLMNSALLTVEERDRIEAMLHEGMLIVERAIEEGTVRSGDSRVIRTVLIAPALHLGRAAARSGEAPDSARAAETFDLCWKAISN